MEPFLGQILLFAFDFVPRAWSACAGAILPVPQNQALASLLDKRFGGDGKTTFGLPNYAAPAPPGPVYAIALQGIYPSRDDGRPGTPGAGSIALILVPYTFVPLGWLPCDGQLRKIADYPALFAVIGKRFGGDGVTTFALPPLTTFAPAGSKYCIAKQGGTFPDRSFIGTVQLFPSGNAPGGWASCDGRTLPIEDFDMLFNLIGTTYGGDGVTTFGVPNLQGLGLPAGLEFCMATDGIYPTAPGR